MINLYQFPSYWGLSSASPFCIKLETYLKLAEIPYKSILLYDPRKAPKGKLPYIIDNNKKIADSSIIIEYLKKTYGDKLDTHLTSEQKAIAVSVQRLCEEHLFWIIMHERWVSESGWKVINPVFFGKLSAPVRWFLPNLIRKNIKKASYIHGIGRFTDDERFYLGKQDIDAIVTLLGSNNYFFGDTPTSIDAILYGFITPLIHTPIEFPLRDYLKKIPALMEYDKRIKEKLRAE